MLSFKASFLTYALVSLLPASILAEHPSSPVTEYTTIASQVEALNGTLSGPACACKVLTDIYGRQILKPNGTAYEAQASHYYDVRADLSPHCIFVPNTTRDVAIGVVVFNGCQSKFAIRGVGHMPVVGAANIDNGVLVSLGALTNISVNIDTVEAGPGLTWYDLNVALEPHGRIVVGGRLKTIGVAGLTLGGGISYFSAKYGFAMDNVIAYEVVLADGAVVNATANSNSDLFWALKGGGNNYGIVTKFTLATYHAPSISTVVQVFAQSEIPQFIEAIHDLAVYQDQVDTGAGGIFIINYNQTTESYSGTFWGVQIGEVKQPAVFDNFTTIRSEVADYNVTTVAAWSSRLDTPYQATRTMFGMHIALATNATMQAMYEYWVTATQKVGGISGFSSALVFQPLPPSAFAVGLHNGVGNTWGLPAESYVFWEIETMWSDKSDDATIQAWVESTVEAIHMMNAKAGVGETLVYYNDAADYQDAFATFPPGNLARMKQIRAKYDPGLVFTNLCPGGYKLEHGPII